MLQWKLCHVLLGGPYPKLTFWISGGAVFCTRFIVLLGIINYRTLNFWHFKWLMNMGCLTSRNQNICLGSTKILLFCVEYYAFTFCQFHNNISCYRRTRSQSCPFCRDSLKRVNSGDLWIYTSSTEVVDLYAITTENLKRLFMYIEKLPFIVPDPAFVSYDPLRWMQALYLDLCSAVLILSQWGL